MIPSYVDSKWSYTTEKFDTVTEMCFPDENYNYDNNLGACLFYIKRGFVIGGLNTNVYKGTKQEGKADIYFYCDVNQI